MGDEHEDLTEQFAEPVQVRKLDLFIIGVDFLRKSVGVIEESLANLEQMLCQHANWLAEKQAFADAARLEIESLTQEE